MKNVFKYNKKYNYPVWILVFLLIYYIFFAQWKVDLTFSAKDLVINKIDNKEDFEDIIVKNVYDKIVESCNPKKQYYSQVYYSNDDSRGWETDVRWSDSRKGLINFWSNKVDHNLMGAPAAELWAIADLSIPSMDFWWWTPEKNITQDVNFSQTNIQKQEVDEWDILKQTKDYIFYFSKAKSKIYIVKSPLDWGKIDLSVAKQIFTINIPSNSTIKPELFVNDSRLVYLASKKSYDNNNTIVWIYDTSNLKNSEVKLIKIFETKWDYFKSRLINNNLYLISDYSMQWFKSKYCNILKNEWSWNISEFISFFTGIKIKWFGINKELYNELKDELESYSYNFNDDNMSWNWNSEKLNDFKVFYTNKDLKESIENLNFDIVSVVDIDKKETKNSQVLMFWNLKNWEIHMTLDNLYLVNSYYQKEKWKCEFIDICSKEFESDFFTSIAKISYAWSDLQYVKSSIIPWKPINQYSMDEDEWYFRIFTSNWNWNTNAWLYVFDKKLKTIWQLENIKPWEQFKSSRFIWDKAFLVTFRQTDPLFVIDLHVPSEPKVIWELQIPGYSSYLHPYWKIWNKDYLIWLWLDNRKVKVDLYEIDYESVWLGGYVNVTQKYTYTFEGDDSTTPALDNPRAFVWDDNDKILYIPIMLSKYYSWTFYWIKALNIDIDKWISEVISKQVWNADIPNSRVGFYKNLSEKALFFVEWQFISFFKDFDLQNIINFN